MCDLKMLFCGGKTSILQGTAPLTDSGGRGCTSRGTGTSTTFGGTISCLKRTIALSPGEARVGRVRSRMGTVVGWRRCSSSGRGEITRVDGPVFLCTSIFVMDLPPRWVMGREVVRFCDEGRTVGHVGGLTKTKGTFLFVVSCGRRYSFVRGISSVSSSRLLCGLGNFAGYASIITPLECPVV